MSDLQDAIDRFTLALPLLDNPGEGAAQYRDDAHVIREAARKYANIIKSGPIPATQCVFPLVKEELLVYPTNERVGYGNVALGITEDADG